MKKRLQWGEAVFLKKIFLCLCFGLFITACSSPASEKKSFLRTAFSTDPSTIDPRKSGDYISSFFQKMLFEGLTRLDENGKVEMALAEKVSISEDGLVYTFFLRDAVWSDGNPITAHDFSYAWKKTLQPDFGAPCAFLFYPISKASEVLKREASMDQVGIEAIDAKTLKISLSHPIPYFLSLISLCPFSPLPAHIDEKYPHWDRDIDFPKRLVSNGPFRLIEWDRNNQISVEKNPFYWDQKNVSLNSIEILIIPDEKTALRMFETGEIDLLNSLSTSLSPDELAHLKQESETEKNYALELAPLGATSFCTFNVAHPILQNLSIRKALSLAINRPSIVQNITQMGEEPAHRYVPTLMAKSKQLKLMDVYDPILAKATFLQGLAELRQQGVPVDSLLSTLAFSYDNKELSRQIAQAIQQEWKDNLGLQVTLQESDFKTHRTDLQRRHYTIALESWGVHYLDPSSILDRFKYGHSSKNYPGFENTKYISFLNAAQMTLDTELRFDILEKAEALIVDEMPLTPIFHFNQILLKSKRFTNILATPLGEVLFRKIKTQTIEEQ
jgi:oligopeptide transport system substrate-binding protein